MELARPLNKYLDHTLLNPGSTLSEFESFLDDTVKYQFASVCVPPYMAAPIKAAMQGEDIKVSTVIGFPFGDIPLDLKIQQILYFAKRGIDELDFVFNYGELKSGNSSMVGAEVNTISEICAKNGITSKCIIETCVLLPGEKEFMFRLLDEYTEIDYIKTSTGVGDAGAQLADVLKWGLRIRLNAEKNSNTDSLILLTPEVSRVNPLKIKASGGITNLNTTLKFIEAGADRVGTSSSVKIMEEYIVSEGAGVHKPKTFTEREGEII